MTQPSVTDFDDGEISVRLDGKELRGWSYKDDAERRVKMLAAREYVEGWCDAMGCHGVVGSPGGRSMIPRETFDLLQIAEGYIRSAVWREETEPPFQRNAKTVNDLAKIQAALAALQNPRSKGSSTCNEPNIHALEIVLEDEISSSMRTDTPQSPADVGNLP